jgi:hypothetical protein
VGPAASASVPSYSASDGSAHGSCATPAGITPFPLLARTRTRAVVEGGTPKQLARAMHDDYCTDRPGERFAVPWPDLPAEMRESNRARRRHRRRAGRGRVLRRAPRRVG